MEILQGIFICGIIYGLISFFITLKKRSNDKNQLTLAISLIIVCAASFIMLYD
ncbi:hypothetical protein IMZ31_04860 [Pontibacillus sp. ALD_SL1]|uniref:hypothetical protein n=1 Tax=Pontibacillus sp. ALD_SL1 TaxID=2777185 RepID=UPI001A9787A2|nr:hypothetical protein [Pontibacillus sp. ALD_SL1]QST00904.1 hypothetical protein IMZ31_04860 [Pontibacillus sp. ALD_SL1]